MYQPSKKMKFRKGSFLFNCLIDLINVIVLTNLVMQIYNILIFWNPIKFLNSFN